MNVVLSQLEYSFFLQPMMVMMMVMIYFTYLAIESDNRVVNLPSYCCDFFFFFCRCCHVMSVKRRCSVAEDARRAHSLLGVADH